MTEEKALSVTTRVCLSEGRGKVGVGASAEFRPGG